jgi:WD40 repeat protein
LASLILGAGAMVDRGGVIVGFSLIVILLAGCSAEQTARWKEDPLTELTRVLAPTESEDPSEALETQAFDTGVEAYRERNFTEARREFEPLAIDGHAYAQYYLALMYQRGLGVPENSETALKWYRRSAAQGNTFAADAITELGQTSPAGRDVVETEEISQRLSELERENRRLKQHLDSTEDNLAVLSDLEKKNQALLERLSAAEAMVEMTSTPLPELVPVTGELLTRARVNVRARPTEIAPILGVLPSGRSVRVTARTMKGDWYRLDIGDERNAFIFASLLYGEVVETGDGGEGNPTVPAEADVPIEGTPIEEAVEEEETAPVRSAFAETAATQISNEQTELTPADSDTSGAADSPPKGSTGGWEPVGSETTTPDDRTPAAGQTKSTEEVPTQVASAAASDEPVKTPRPLSFKLRGGAATALCFLDDAKFVIAGFRGGRLNVLDVATGKSVRTLKGHTGTVRAIALSSDGRVAATAAEDKTVRTWDVETGKEIRVFEGHTDKVLAVAFAVGDRLLLSGSADETARVWDVQSGASSVVFAEHQGPVGAVVGVPGKPLALSASSDVRDGSVIRIWNVEAGLQLGILNGHRSPVYALAATPDGTHAISGSRDKSIKTWDLAGKRLIRTFGVLEGHRKAVRAVAVSSDGKFVVSGSDDATLMVWDAVGGELLHTLKGHKKNVTALALSADGGKIVSGSRDKSLRVWPLNGEFSITGE